MHVHRSHKWMQLQRASMSLPPQFVVYTLSKCSASMLANTPLQEGSSYCWEAVPACLHKHDMHDGAHTVSG